VPALTCPPREYEDSSVSDGYLSRWPPSLQMVLLLHRSEERRGRRGVLEVLFFGEMHMLPRI